MLNKKINHLYPCLGYCYKKILLVALILFLSTTLKAQSIVKTTIDTLSGDTSIRTSTEQLFGQPSLSGSGGMQVYYSFLTLKKNVLLTLIVQTQKADPFMIMPDSVTTLVFRDTSGVDIHCNQPFLSNFRGSGNGIVIYYTLSLDALSAILQDKLMKLRISYNGGLFEFDIADDNAQKFMNAAGLLKNN